MTKEKILIVDDEEYMRRLIKVWQKKIIYLRKRQMLRKLFNI